MKILVVCQHNAGRSQIAATIMRSQYPHWQVRSAGLGPDLKGEVVPTSVVDTLAQIGLYLDPTTPRTLLTPELAEWADSIILFTHPDTWPTWLSRAKSQYWPVEDPRKQPLEVLRQARDEIASRVSRLTYDIPTTPLKVICLPGFGDPIVGERWVSDLAASLPLSVEAWDWPGLWTRSNERVSFSRLTDEVAAVANPNTVFVGHSLGGRVALQVAASKPAAGVVAICSPRQLSLNTEAAANLWRSSGARPTHRYSPTGLPVTYQLPVSFLNELNAWLTTPKFSSTPTLMLFGDSDPKAKADDWRDLIQPDVTVSVLPNCTHRFMDHSQSRKAAVTQTIQFIQSLRPSV